jgi:hypothetical protein
MKTINFEDIKPVGNFEQVLIKLREKVDSITERCYREKTYNKSLADCIKLIVGELGVIDVLEEGILKKEGWNIDEMIICLLYTHILIIDLNDAAQTFLNKIEMPSRISQLQDMIDNKPEIYGKLKLI